MIDNIHVLNSKKPYAENQLFRELQKVIQIPELIKIFYKYEVGTSHKGTPVFWHLTPNMEMVNGICDNVPIFAKNPTGAFGMHLLRDADPGEVILMITNRPESVLAMNAYLPIIGKNQRKAIWISTSTIQAVQFIEKFEIVIIPENNKWVDFCEKLLPWTQRHNRAKIFTFTNQMKSGGLYNLFVGSGESTPVYEKPMAGKRILKSYKTLSGLYGQYRNDDRVRLLCDSLDCEITNIQYLQHAERR